MSKGLNRVMLIGTISDPPKHRVTATGKERLWLRLCVVESYADKQGEIRESSGWHTIVIWGARAAALHPILHAGQRIAVDGRLETWKREGDPPRWQTEVAARDVILLDRAAGTVALRPPDRDAA